MAIASVPEFLGRLKQDRFKRDTQHSVHGMLGVPIAHDSVIGGLTGLAGSILRPLFWSMNSDPFFIFGIAGMILRSVGIGGCDWKSSFCPVGDFFGYIITIIIFSLIGLLIGFIVGWANHTDA